MHNEAYIIDLIADSPMRPDTQRRVRDGLELWLRTGGDLHVCLGLNRPDVLRSLRNRHLVTVIEACDGDPKRAAQAVREFEARTWPRVCGRDWPDPAWPRAKQQLWFAFRYHDIVGVPRTAKQLRTIQREIGAPSDFPASEQ